MPLAGERTRVGHRAIGAMLAFLTFAVTGSEHEPSASHHQQWTRAQGLPDDRVQAILQTRDGYLWIGTRRGLARFDGIRFKVINRASHPEIASDDCRHLAEDIDGSLWIGTADGLLHLAGADIRREGLNGDTIKSLCSRRQGGVWIATENGLIRLHCGDVRMFTNGMPSITTLLEDNEGNLQIGTEIGLHRFDSESGGIQKNVDPGIPTGPVKTMAADAQGGFWILSGTAGFPLLYHLKDGRWRSTKVDAVHKDMVTFIAVSAQGGVFVPRALDGLCEYRNGTSVNHRLPRPGSRALNVVTILGDREGNLWIGTEATGLWRWRPPKLVAYSTRDGLLGDAVRCVFPAQESGAWIGTDNGLTRYAGGHLRHFPNPTGVAQQGIRALAEDRTGRLWIGTSRGLMSIVLDDCTPYPLTGDSAETKVRTLLVAQDRTLWVGTAKGLVRIRDKQATRYTTADGLSDDDVRVLLQDHSGSIWIGTAGGGLNSIPATDIPALPPAPAALDSHASPRNGRVRFRALTRTNGLSSNFIFSLYEDSRGVLWVGTENGINRLEEGRFFHFTLGHGLCEEVINGIVEDDLSRLWISTDHGIWRVSRQEMNDVADGRTSAVHSVRYGEADGMPTSETNGQISQPTAVEPRTAVCGLPPPRES